MTFLNNAHCSLAECYAVHIVNIEIEHANIKFSIMAEWKGKHYLLSKLTGCVAAKMNYR